MTIELPDQDNKFKRRTFFKAGIAVGSFLIVYKLFKKEPASTFGSLKFITHNDYDVLKYLIPGIIFSTNLNVDQMVKDLDATINNLPLATQNQLRDLFKLLNSSILIRGPILGAWKSWVDMKPKDIHEWMEDLKTSRFLTKRQVFEGLNKLVHGVYYARPETWESIGYPGPPEVSV